MTEREDALLHAAKPKEVVLLGYDYLGDWTDRAGNQNLETEYLRPFLKRQGYDEALMTRALHLLEKAASDTSKSLYDRNKEGLWPPALRRTGQAGRGREYRNRLADRLEELGEQSTIPHSSFLISPSSPLHEAFFMSRSWSVHLATL